MLSFAYALHAMYVCSMCRYEVYAPFTACELHGGLVIYAVCAVYAFVHYMNLAVRVHMLYVQYALCVTYAAYEVCAAAYGIYIVFAIHAVCVVNAASGIYAVCAVCAIYAMYAYTAAQTVYAVCAASSTHRICNIISSIFINVCSIFIDFVYFHGFFQIFSDFYRFTWISIDSQWISTDFYGFQWIFMISMVF